MTGEAVAAVLVAAVLSEAPMTILMCMEFVSVLLEQVKSRQMRLASAALSVPMHWSWRADGRWET